MEKNKIILALTFVTVFLLNGNAQNNKIGCVTYKVDRYVLANEKDLVNDPYLNAFRTLEYELIFNKSKSIYQLIDKLYDTNSMDAVGIAQMVAGYYFYKDLEAKEKIRLNDLDGEKLYIINDFNEYKWEISTETKIIDGFQCMKATAFKESELNGKIKRLNKFYPTVWFAPAIPVPFGPYGLDGLPGLVLEASFNGRIYFYATNINLNCNSKKALEKPKIGKFISEDELTEIISKSINDMFVDRP